ncbi:hypothetical protein PHMEG_00032018 [Phytophthora megakarya]|uniref:Uncharacterized protein n=1 Tax=Phytophthora megakarya TaxID=4795 RepID=A0A225UWX6_9STRA|nr:hypothetical protein PHMEG_00032018 [Phytophthora megakarya]
MHQLKARVDSEVLPKWTNVMFPALTNYCEDKFLEAHISKVTKSKCAEMMKKVSVVSHFLAKRLATASAELVNGVDLWEPLLEVLGQ